MTTSYVLPSGEETTYGLGLMMVEHRGLQRVTHGGADTAHRSHFVFFPELNAGLVVLTNHPGAPAAVITDLEEIFFGEHMEPEGEPLAEVASGAAPFDPDAFDPALFDAYTGRYELEAMPGFILSFRRDGARLIGQATGQPEFDLRATSDSTFAITIVEASVTFHREGGEVTSLTLHQNGHHRATRLADESQALDLAPFVGRYFSEELETFYSFSLEDDRLVLRHRRLDDVPLAHASGDSFSGAFPVMTVAFERDASGAVTGLLAGNGRTRDVRFTRVE